jgi:hypothetical protein
MNGKRNWCVKVKKALCQKGEIYLMADMAETALDGSIVFKNHKDQEDTALLIIPAGSWTAVYAASVIDGSAVAVTRWDEEIIAIDKF